VSGFSSCWAAWRESSRSDHRRDRQHCHRRRWPQYARLSSRRVIDSRPRSNTTASGRWRMRYPTLLNRRERAGAFHHLWLNSGSPRSFVPTNNADHRGRPLRTPRLLRRRLFSTAGTRRQHAPLGMTPQPPRRSAWSRGDSISGLATTLNGGSQRGNDVQWWQISGANDGRLHADPECHTTCRSLERPTLPPFRPRWPARRVGAGNVVVDRVPRQRVLRVATGHAGGIPDGPLGARHANGSGLFPPPGGAAPLDLEPISDGPLDYSAFGDGRDHLGSGRQHGGGRVDPDRRHATLNSAPRRSPRRPFRTCPTHVTAMPANDIDRGRRCPDADRRHQPVLGDVSIDCAPGSDPTTVDLEGNGDSLINTHRLGV